MTLYLGNNLISGVATPTEPTRNLGQIIESIVPLTDAGLHLLDGSLINGSGIYSDFVTAMGDIYSTTEVVGYKSNVTKVGSLADTDGVLNGFSTSNYATLPTVFSPSSNTWEIVIKLKTSTINTRQEVIGLANASTFGGPLLRIKDNNKIFFDASTNGTDWNGIILESVSSVSANTDYTIKVKYTGSAYELYINDVLDNSLTSSTPIYPPSVISYLGLIGNGTYPFLGTMDLNESYININGNRWWTGTYAVKPMFCDEAQWQNSVNTYGVCGKFVYDSVANTVRLPKITGILEGTTDVNALGDLVEQLVRLPNITGTTSFVLINNNTVSTGSFYTYDNATSGVQGSSTSARVRTINLDASRSSSVYSGDGTDTKIQPQTIKAFYYIVIATTTKTDIQVDIDEIATDLNGKADTDLTNINNTAKITMAHNAMPSNTYINLTVGASGTTYTAPADGYFAAVSNAGTGESWFVLTNSITGLGSYCQCPAGWDLQRASIPASKGDVITFDYGNVTVRYLHFIYANGSESEAQ